MSFLQLMIRVDAEATAGALEPVVLQLPWTSRLALPRD